MALRRAFNVALPTIEEQWDRLHDQVGDVVALQEHHVPEHGIPLQSDVVIDAEDYEAGPLPATRISEMKARLNDADGETRSRYRSMFDDPTELTDEEVDKAYTWVVQHTSVVEPF